ncbi:metal ABC transporter ATP-binding protein [Staphylococcus simiae]|uniref:Manganese ABC transporter ATP binding protein n=1 Tax=Staphylococcus simiae CCM 7213 = CCUG 51256 TaxID=911238 RepID=G5JHK3_9STAP|nr:metal ABC transporter ATP-binding protein [Staphylococcus simiae]EHJ08336.1 manganese ABC transporter ATP binding protein [Staphylococcus simiae CCM 7213 = CCUG 51256]PNZ13859.1 metal ABC transporter ATP-binding protein [Staphylococcus simiae]SNV59843.1 Mn2+/Zn2+ ABC transporter ATPase [Staphylococcus simiae]
MLKVKNLAVRYNNGTEALKDVTFNLDSGQIYGIIGPNGAGKSTLLKAIVNLIPHKGSVEFNEHNILKELKNISYVEQKSNIDTSFPMNVLDSVVVGIYPKLKPWQFVTKQMKQQAEDALKQVDMCDFKDRQLDELSGGQFQRVLIARTLIQQTDLILLDEPFVGIDVYSEDIIIDLLHDLVAQGKTILIVHHDLSKVKKYFDGVIIINKSIVAMGPVDEAFTTETLSDAYGTGIFLPSVNDSESVGDNSHD